MKRIISGVIALTLLTSLGLVGASCVPIVEAKTGTIEVWVTDAPPEYNIASIDITFSEVAVHKAGNDGEGGWITLEIVGGSFDLLELQAEDLEALLATEEVTAGKYTQLRVIIDTIEVTLEGVGEPPEVILPSGELKFVRPFEVVDGETTIILLDFDAEKSVVVTGQGKVIVKPVVKLTIQQGGKPHQLTSVEGTISAVNTQESTISIIPDGGTEDDTIVLDVNPQTEITLGGEEATLAELGEGNSVTASYYLNNLKAIQIDAGSPSG